MKFKSKLEQLQFYESCKRKALKLYQSGLTYKQVSAMLNIHSETVGRWCRQAKISRHQGAQSLTKYEDFFDVIDTEEKAYFLGFIMADGNVSTHNNQWVLKWQLKYEDHDIIDKFCDCVQTSIARQVRYMPDRNGIKRHKVYCISLTSKYMVKALMNAGVQPNKSNKEVLPSVVPDNLIHHFIRGYFDGDGHIAKNCKSLTICGGFDILSNINKIAFDNQAHIRYHYGTYLLSKSAYKFIQGFYNYAYKDATIYLVRKYNIFKSCFS